jgi:Arabinose-binding domain of AraC transcription regulator, N-term
MGEETSQQGLPTTTGFAAREAIAMLRKHNIATAPLLLRAGLSEHGLARADEGNCLALRVSAIGQCKFLEHAAEAMNDSAFGLHLAGQIDPRGVGMYFYAGSAARDLGEALALFSRYCRIVNEAFRLTQRSADTAIEFEFVGLPRYAARHNMEYVVGRPLRWHCERCQAATSSQRKSRSPTTGIPTSGNSSGSSAVRSSLARQTPRSRSQPMLSAFR